MSNLGLAYLSMTTTQAIALASAGEFKSLAAASGETDVLDGFFFGTDFNTVAKGNADNDVVLRVNLDEVLDLVDVIEAVSPENSGYTHFALGADKFTVSADKFSYLDSTMIEFLPLSQILVTDAKVPSAEAVAVEEAQTETGAEAAPVKKVYDTPYLPRGQYFKKLREQGLLQPRQPKVKAEQKADQPKRVRSEAEMKAIRGFYARKKAAMAA